MCVRIGSVVDLGGAAGYSLDVVYSELSDVYNLYLIYTQSTRGRGGLSRLAYIQRSERGVGEVLTCGKPTIMPAHHGFTVGNPH